MAILHIEVADSPTKRSYGLMDRKSLANNSGMLFKFPNDNYRSFWMQNTYIPLDIAFIDDHGKIFQIEKMVPMSTKPVTSSAPCKYVLEVNRGWFGENDLRVGSKVGLSGVGQGSRKLIVAQDLGMEGNDLDLQEGVQEPPQDEGNAQTQQQNPQEQEKEPSANFSDSKLTGSFKQRFSRANNHNKLIINRERLVDMLVFYQTEEHGMVLLPRICRGYPNFTFEQGVNGELVRLLDVSPLVSGVNPDGSPWECAPGEKTFILSNILHLTEVLRSDPSQDVSDKIVAWYRESNT